MILQRMGEEIRLNNVYTTITLHGVFVYTKVYICTQDQPFQFIQNV